MSHRVRIGAVVVAGLLAAIVAAVAGPRFAVAAGEDLPHAGCADPTFSGEPGEMWSEATTLQCSWTSEVVPGVSPTMTISFRIDAAEVGDDGFATVHEMDGTDPDLSNNTAPIVITALSGGAGAAASR